MTWAPDAPASTLEILAALMESPLPPMPPQEQRFGASVVSWWETDPGYVYIHAEGGSSDDRFYAQTLVAMQLTPHGYRRASFEFDSPSFRKTAGWPDIMAKAKRLIQSGQVTVLRNGFHNIVGHVIGDHGEYNTEISRDDPSSRSITGWQCECPWDQYAWQRTRKWKKFEGRPCSHTLALFWKALSTPFDEQLSQDQIDRMGTGQKIGPGAGGGPPSGGAPLPGGTPTSFGPDGQPIQGDQMQFPPDAMGGPPGPAQAPLAPPPGPTPPGILPPFPGAQQEMQWGGPGTTPGGGQSPIGIAVSVPGAKMPSPFNPIQYPGGTYSKMHTAAEFNPPEIVRLKKPAMGQAEGPVQGQYGDGSYRDVPVGSTGEVLAQDEFTGWVEVIFPLDDSGYHEPYHVRCFLEPTDIEHTRLKPPGPFIKRVT